MNRSECSARNRGAKTVSAVRANIVIGDAAVLPFPTAEWRLDPSHAVLISRQHDAYKIRLSVITNWLRYDCKTTAPWETDRVTSPHPRCGQQIAQIKQQVRSDVFGAGPLTVFIARSALQQQKSGRKSAVVF